MKLNVQVGFDEAGFYKLLLKEALEFVGEKACETSQQALADTLLRSINENVMQFIKIDCGMGV
jgi:hypothetical protein